MTACEPQSVDTVTDLVAVSLPAMHSMAVGLLAFGLGGQYCPLAIC